MKKLAELGVVREVTNQKDINNDFAFIFEKVVPTRVRQASDDATREKANKLLGSVTKQAQCAELYDDSATSDKIVLTTRTHLELECPCDKYSDHLIALEAIHKSNIDLVGQIMEDAIV